MFITYSCLLFNIAYYQSTDFNHIFRSKENNFPQKTVFLALFKHYCHTRETIEVDLQNKTKQSNKAVHVDLLLKNSVV